MINKYLEIFQIYFHLENYMKEIQENDTNKREQHFDITTHKKTNSTVLLPSYIIGQRTTIL